MIIAVAVTTIVLGAGMSTASCGSMCGSHIVDVNCQNAITRPSSARLGKKVPTRTTQASTGLVR